MSEGGEGPSGQIISEETRRRLSISHKGIVNRVGFKQPEYVKQKISETLSGRKLSKETCRRMSISRTGSKHPMFGKKHSEESRRKNAEAHKKLTEREVNTIRKMYESGKYRQWELADMFGVCQMTISHVTRRSLYLYA
jgi:DNA-directed RNA polymerase specialized sigma subunit